MVRVHAGELMFYTAVYDTAEGDGKGVGRGTVERKAAGVGGRSGGDEGAHVVAGDLAFEALDAVDDDDGDAIAIPLEEGVVGADVDLGEVVVVVGGEVVEVIARLVAEVTAGFGVEDDAHHVDSRLILAGIVGRGRSTSLLAACWGMVPQWGKAWRARRLPWPQASGIMVPVPMESPHDALSSFSLAAVVVC